MSYNHIRTVRLLTIGNGGTGHTVKVDSRHPLRDDEIQAALAWLMDTYPKATTAALTQLKGGETRE